MDRQTTTITLPDSSAVVTLYAQFTYGDFRLIQKKMLETVKIDLSGVDSGSDGKDLMRSGLKEVPGTIAFDEQELTLTLLIKSVVASDGTSINDINQFIYNISMTDGNFLQAKVEEISKTSSLSSENKKK